MNNWDNHKTNEEVLEYNRKERLGQTGISKYGLSMTVVDYRNSDDIDINIDGTIVKHKRYKDFVSGNICKTQNDVKFIRIGEKVVNFQGLIMMCFDYRLANDIDIKFEDGTILEHKDYYAFKKGKYRNPNFIKPEIIKVEKPKLTHKGESIIAKNGMKMTIIDYRDTKDMDIQFEDGTIVYHKRYQHFKNGEINNPNLTGTVFTNKERRNRIGEKVISKDGVELTIVAYRNRKDIDIQLPDRTILEHRKYERFKDGSIDCSDYIKRIRVGKTNTNVAGLKMTVVRYQNSGDIDVQFADGKTVKAKYKDFLDGTILYPRERLGETNIHNDGLYMTVIRYGSASDIDVEFEDGYIARNIEYRRFSEGTIKHPFPYMLGTCQVESRAYNYGTERNLFYICKNCHHHDIGTIEEIRNHVCKEI